MKQTISFAFHPRSVKVPVAHCPVGYLMKFAHINNAWVQKKMFSSPFDSVLCCQFSFALSALCVCVFVPLTHSSRI